MGINMLLKVARMCKVFVAVRASIVFFFFCLDISIVLMEFLHVIDHILAFWVPEHLVAGDLRALVPVLLYPVLPRMASQQVGDESWLLTKGHLTQLTPVAVHVHVLSLCSSSNFPVFLVLNIKFNFWFSVVTVITVINKIIVIKIFRFFCCI